MSTKSILFLCTGNSARSQMAEAILRHIAGDSHNVVSAGTQIVPIDPRTHATLKKFSIDDSMLCSTHFDEVINQSFDYVITLCDDADRVCLEYSGANKLKALNQISWSFIDPKAETNANDPLIFDKVFLAIYTRLKMLLDIDNQISTEALLDNQIPKFEPTVFFKGLTDDIRLNSLMLMIYFGELCVCELMTALQEDSQPKVSRNLAVLKKAGILSDRKHGQWVFYRVNPQLPQWAKSVLAETAENNINQVIEQVARLTQMADRPSKSRFCQ